MESCTVLDRAAACDRLGLEEDLIDELAHSLLERSRETLAEIAAALQSGQFHRAEDGAHSIKGSAATLEANDLAAAAQRLELLARSKVFDQCQDAWQELNVALDKLAAVLGSE